MKIGDLVKIGPRYDTSSSKIYQGLIAMIVEGPNEVGKIRLILPNGTSIWKHSSEVEYLPKAPEYLKQ